MLGMVRLWPTGILSALLWLGCSGRGGQAPAAPTPSSVPDPPPLVTAGPYALAPGTLTLPVLPPAYPPAGGQPYAGTVTCTVDRSAGPGAAVTLSVDPAQLPRGVRAQFNQTTIPAGGTTAVLSFQAGYPDPADPTFATQIQPVPGTVLVPVTAATPGLPDTVLNLTLALTQEPVGFALNFFNADRQATVLTNLNLAPGGGLSETLMAYWTQGVTTTLGPGTLGTRNVPPGLSVTFDGGIPGAQAVLNEPHSLNLQAGPDLGPGLYGFEVTATFWGATRTLPLVVTCGPAPFSLLPPLAPSVSVAQGQTLIFPMYLWHDDTYFADTGGPNPVYVGGTNLSVTGLLPPGLAVTFQDGAPTSQASSLLVIQAGKSVPPGAYPLALNAVRTTGSTTVAAPPVPLEVVVTAPGDAPALWLQQVEWGQTVLAPNLRLVGGKPALLRVQVLADRPGVSAPTVLATVTDAQGRLLDTLTLSGPAQVPMVIGEGDLPGVPSAPVSTFMATLPAADLQPGMQVTLTAGGPTGFAPRTVAPAVAPGFSLPLTVVPVVHKGLAPVLPTDATLTETLLALWPLQGLDLGHRAPYTTSTVLPQPASPDNGDGWAQLLSELASVRIVDGGLSNYYGFLNPGIETPFAFSVSGISHLGDGVGLGIDLAQESLYQNADAPRDLATMIMAHELGHAFNLNHAPAGGAAGPQLNYPYPGAALGSWGYDPATGQAYAPGALADLMAYGPLPRWLSDWDYRNAQAFLEACGGAQGSPAAADRAAGDQWVASGWIDAAGRAHLLPLVRSSGRGKAPVDGPFQLALAGGDGSRLVPFAASSIPDLPGGCRAFAFTVPAAGELTWAEVRGPGRAAGPAARRTVSLGLEARARAVDEALANQRLQVREAAGCLQLAWDPTIHPWVNVFHEGARRTTLALHLAGGSARVSLAGLPGGGRFAVQFSDGLNPVSRNFTRAEQIPCP